MKKLLAEFGVAAAVLGGPIAAAEAQPSPAAADQVAHCSNPDTVIDENQQPTVVDSTLFEACQTYLAKGISTYVHIFNDGNKQTPDTFSAFGNSFMANNVPTDQPAMLIVVGESNYQSADGLPVEIEQVFDHPGNLSASLMANTHFISNVIFGEHQLDTDLADSPNSTQYDIGAYLDSVLSVEQAKQPAPTHRIEFLLLGATACIVAEFGVLDLVQRTRANRIHSKGMRQYSAAKDDINQRFYQSIRYMNQLATGDGIAITEAQARLVEASRSLNATADAFRDLYRSERWHVMPRAAALQKFESHISHLATVSSQKGQDVVTAMQTHDRDRSVAPEFKDLLDQRQVEIQEIRRQLTDEGWDIRVFNKFYEQIDQDLLALPALITNEQFDQFTEQANKLKDSQGGYLLWIRNLPVQREEHDDKFEWFAEAVESSEDNIARQKDRLQHFRTQYDPSCSDDLVPMLGALDNLLDSMRAMSSETEDLRGILSVGAIARGEYLIGKFHTVHDMMGEMISAFNAREQQLDELLFSLPTARDQLRLDHELLCQYMTSILPSDASEDTFEAVIAFQQRLDAFSSLDFQQQGAPLLSYAAESAALASELHYIEGLFMKARNNNAWRTASQPHPGVSGIVAPQNLRSWRDSKDT